MRPAALHLVTVRPVRKEHLRNAGLAGSSTSGDCPERIGGVIMKAVLRQDVPVVIEGDGVEVRLQEIGGGMSASFIRLPKGADLGPALKGLTDDRCPCPHWGYLLSGRLLMRTADGEKTYTGGQAFYWAPGHVRWRSRTATTSTSHRPTSSTRSSITFGLERPDRFREESRRNARRDGTIEPTSSPALSR